MAEFVLARAGRDAFSFARLMECAVKTLIGRKEMGGYVDELVEYPQIRDHIFQGHAFVEDGFDDSMGGEG